MKISNIFKTKDVAEILKKYGYKPIVINEELQDFYSQSPEMNDNATLFTEEDLEK